MSPAPLTAFVSYTREDSTFVLRLVEALSATGVNVWLDQQSIEPGQDWADAIHEGLIHASWFLAILSPAAVRSKNVQAEINLALEENKTIVPVLYQDCIVPWRLRTIQHSDFRSDFDASFHELLRALRVAGSRESRAEVKGLEQLRRQVAEQAASQRRSLQDRSAGTQASVEADDEFSRAERAAAYIFGRTALRPKIALVLGSGLGAFANELHSTVRIPYADIPFFPKSTAIGHRGELVIGNADTIPVTVMQGRAHYYEGYTLQQVAFPVRVLGLMGTKALVLTNAAGGINPRYGAGALVVVSDHINLQGGSPLIGVNDDRFGPRFPDMTYAYNSTLRRFALEEAGRLGAKMDEGVYVALHGPSYETPAEIRFLRTIGADLVGMSTVPEVIVARHMGMEVLAISVVTNMAAGMTGEKLDHVEVLEMAQRVTAQFVPLLRAVLPKIERWLHA